MSACVLYKLCGPRSVWWVNEACLLSVSIYLSIPLPLSLSSLFLSHLLYPPPRSILHSLSPSPLSFPDPSHWIVELLLYQRLYAVFPRYVYTVLEVKEPLFVTH